MGDLMEMRNTGYTVLLIDGTAVQVFRLAETPKSVLIRQFAHLIIPPNNLTPVKDRWSLFTCENWPIVSEDVVVSHIKQMLSRDGGQNG